MCHGKLDFQGEKLQILKLEDEFITGNGMSKIGNNK